MGLGHKTEITRTGGDNSFFGEQETFLSIIMYQGINDFTLTGKDVISFDFDRSTGKARMKVYGDTYIGDKDRGTYIEYTQDKGVDIKESFISKKELQAGRMSKVYRKRYSQQQIKLAQRAGCNRQCCCRKCQSVA